MWRLLPQNSFRTCFSMLSFKGARYQNRGRSDDRAPAWEQAQQGGRNKGHLPKG